MSIREERPGDAVAIRRVNQRAFGRPDEADLVDALRVAGAALLSLVAEQEGELVGHILFSPATVASPGGSWQAVGLGPMSVPPDLQRQGIGGDLVRDGLERLRAAGHLAVVLVGHPNYYPQFGFVPGERHGLRWEVDAPAGVFQVLELRPGALLGKGGVVRFRPEFASI
jgi:putative acetyltransferase